jgi:uncharacterized protein involved in exopolysaccharide biosynthesis
MKQFLVGIALAVGSLGVVVGYAAQSDKHISSSPETTPAYGVLVLHKVAVESELADLSERLTSEHPSVKRKRFELRAIRIEMSKMRTVEKSRVTKLSSTVGSLILSKVALEVELNDLQGSLTSQHPDVKKKSRDLAALEREIESVLR